MAEIRPPAVAGMFYPGQSNALREAIEGYLQQATSPHLSPVRALIAPHAGYMYSGPVAAYAYRLLSEQEIKPQRVFILGPSHRAWFPGVAVSDVDGFRTPSGVQPVDRVFATEISERWRIFSAINTPHEPEHCLEVQVPFLQMVLPDIPIVPMLFGEVDPIEVGKALLEILRPEDLIIVSSDLSHYHANKAAHDIDARFLDAILKGDKRGVAGSEACGQAPALTLMTIAEDRGWQPHLLDYRTSGDVTGEQRQVVGYAAVAYVEGGRA